MPSVETPPGVFRISIRGFLVFFTLSVCLVAGQTPKYLLQGQTVSFVTDIREPPNEILWKHDGNKVVEFDGSEQKAFGSYEHRVTLGWHSADLTISNLRYEDSGLYELETYINKKLDRKQYQLEVIDKVAKPEISCKIINKTTEKSGGQATLTCSSASSYPQSLLKFQWSSETNSHDGPKIMISLGDDHDDHIYNCSVSNPLSKDSAVFQAKDCYPDTESNAGMIAAIVVPLFLIIFGGIVLMLWFRHKRGPERSMDKDKRAAIAPEVPAKSELARQYSRLKKAGDGIINPDVNKQGSDDPEDSGNPDDEVAAVSDNQKENWPLLHEYPNSPSKQRNGLHDRSQGGSVENKEKTALLPPGSSPESPKKNNLANPLAANGNIDLDVEKQDLDDPKDSWDPNKEFSAVLDNQSEKEEAEGYGNSFLPIPDSDNPFSDVEKQVDVNLPKNGQLDLKPFGYEETNTSNDHNDEVAAVSDNQSPERSMDKDTKEGDGIINPEDNKQGSDDPEDSGNKDDEVAAVSDNQSGDSKVPDGDGGGPERRLDKDKRVLIAPKVPPKPKVARNFSISNQARDENINPEDNKQGSDDPEDSGNKDDEVAAVSDNQNKEVEEEEIAHP